MKRVLYFVAFLFFGISLGWLGRSQCHPHGFMESWSPFRSLCMASSVHPPGPPGGGPPPDRFLEELDVSEAQKARIKEIDAAHRPELERLRSEMNKRREAFDEALASSASLSEVAPKFEALFEAKRQAETEQFKMMMDVREQLSPDQRRELQQRRRDHHGPFHGGPGAVGPGGPGGP